jgi:hypothetical protein
MTRSGEFNIGSSAPEPQKLDMKAFTPYFKQEGEKTLRNEPINLEELKQHSGVKLMGERIAETAEKARKMGLEEKAFDFYPNEKRQMEGVGTRFNNARNAAGLKPYFSDKPELAGALLQAGYSQRSLEKVRKAMVEKSANTGLILPHVAQRRMQHAVDNDIHPINLFGLKLRDFTGSSIDPKGWHGEFEGEKRGTGHTIDRHQYDAAMNQKFGETDRGISGSPTNERRYRTMQAAHDLAHDMYDPSRKLSPSQFQALSWGGWRGGYD